MSSDSAAPDDLERFVAAQEEGRTYRRALAELRAGRKRSHWIWFVFPQIEGLGHSPNSRFFAIRSLEEAKAYLDHPLLGPRLGECCDALLAAGPDDAAAILGEVDALKLRSSMTLFRAAAAPDSPFEEVLSRFFGGNPDPETLARLA